MVAYFTPRDPKIVLYRRTVDKPVGFMETVTHELLHWMSVGRRTRPLTARQANFEEGLAEAVSLDLFPSLIAKVNGGYRFSISPSGYQRQVAVVRDVSARMCGTSDWRSSCARAFRVRLVNTPPEARPALLGQP